MQLRKGVSESACPAGLVVVVVALLAACGGSKTAGSGGAGTSGSATMDGGIGQDGGSKGGGAGSSSAGTSGGKGAAGSGSAGTSGGAGGGAGHGSAGASGGAGSGSDAGLAADGGTMHLADLPGPTTADPQPTTIGLGYKVKSLDSKSDYNNICRLALGLNGTYLVAGGRSAPISYDYVANIAANRSSNWINSPPTQPRVGIGAVAFSSTGETLLGGETNTAVPGETQVGTTDAITAKLDASGKQKWIHQWGATGSQDSTCVAAGPSGSLLVAGTCSGQVPGNPATNAHGPFVARYEADGTRTWIKQYSSLGIQAFFADASGNVITGGSVGAPGFVFSTLSSTGAISAQGRLPAMQIPSFSSLTSGGSVTRSPDGMSFYDLAIGGPGAWLAHMNLDGSLIWYRNGATQTATIDPVEGVIWTGRFSSTSTQSVAATKDSIYISGMYSNTYKNGSVPKPSSYRPFVGRYDLIGNQVWFHEFTFDESSLAKPPTNPNESIDAIVTDANGNVVVAMSGVGPVDGATQGTYQQGYIATLFVLKKGDGSLM